MDLWTKFAWTKSGKICRRWKSRPDYLRTFNHLHDFPNEVWEDGLRLSENKLDHRTAVLRLLQHLVTDAAYGHGSSLT